MITMNASDREETLDALIALMRVVRGCQRPEMVEKIKAAKPENLVAMASAHKLVPSLAPAFELPSIAAAVDPELNEFFRFMRQSNIERNRILLKQLSKLVKHFADLGLEPPVVLKGGGFLAESQHPPPDRFMIDIDLLVAPNNFNVAIKAMEELGYSASKDKPFNQLFDLHYPAFIHPDYDGSVELHFRLSQNDNIDWFDWSTLLAHSRLVTLSGANIYLPNNEWRLFHLAYHNQNNSHFYTRRIISLRDCLDYFDLAIRPGLDFAAVQSTFRKIGAEAEFAGIAAFTRNIFNDLLPQDKTIQGGEKWAKQAKAVLIRKGDLNIWIVANWLQLFSKKLVSVDAWKASFRLIRNKKQLRTRVTALRRQLGNRLGPDG